MGFVGFLKFAFKCFDLIAWPLFGLGCPLYASIRAIENNSNSEMRNLVAYWILFSVVSLFELAFVKLIEWIPLWPYMKLVAMCLLVLPDFNGASYAYERLLRPCLSVDPRAVIKYLLIKKRAVNKYFVRSKEEKSLSAESLRALVERYAQENGYEALEKLLDQKSKHAKPDIGMEEIKAITNTEEKETAAAIQSKYQEPIVGKMDARAVEQLEKSPVAATKLSKVREPSVGKENANMGQLKDENPAVATEQVKFEDPNLVQNEKKTVATGEIKEKTAGAAGEENKAVEITLEKVQREWTCALCQMTAPSEKVLDYHLQGRKHKAKLQMLEASKQNKGSSSSADSPEPTKTLDVDRPNDNSTKKQENKVRANMTNEQCVEKESKVREPSGGKENANPGQLKDENPAVATEQVKFAYQNLVQNEEKTVATGEVKEKTVGATLEKVQREWTCALCQVTTPTEQIFDSHLQGRKHKAKLQKLEASKQNKGSSSSAASPEPKKTLDVDGPNDNSTKKQECKVWANMTNEQCVEKEVDNTGCGMAQSIFWCSICDVKLLSEIDFTSHVGGKKHISKTQEHMINAWGGGYY